MADSIGPSESDTSESMILIFVHWTLEQLPKRSLEKDYKLLKAKLPVEWSFLFLIS